MASKNVRVASPVGLGYLRYNCYDCRSDREPSTQLAIDIDGEPNEDLGYIVNKPEEGPRLLGGHGHPRRCRASWDWLRAQIRDIVVRRVGSESELEKEAFRMAMGGENSCNLVRDSQLHEELLQLLQKWIEGSVRRTSWLFHRANLFGSGSYALSSTLLEIRIGTFFTRRATQNSSCFRGADFLEARQRPVGTCASLGAKLSVGEHRDFVRAKFEEDVAEGLMDRMTSEFKAKFGEHRAIASLAVIVRRGEG